MTESEFDNFLERQTRAFAEEKVRSGAWPPAEALAMSERIFGKLLPRGLSSDGQYLFTVRDDADAVGYLWFEARRSGPLPEAYLYELLIFEGARRRGYGAQAMKQLEERVATLGLGRIALHVFGHNQAAQAPYRKLGYVVTDLNMAKGLGGS